MVSNIEEFLRQRTFKWKGKTHSRPIYLVTQGELKRFGVPVFNYSLLGDPRPLEDIEGLLNRYYGCEAAARGLFEKGQVERLGVTVELSQFNSEGPPAAAFGHPSNRAVFERFITFKKGLWVRDI